MHPTIKAGLMGTWAVHLKRKLQRVDINNPYSFEADDLVHHVKQGLRFFDDYQGRLAEKIGKDLFDKQLSFYSEVHAPKDYMREERLERAAELGQAMMEIMKEDYQAMIKTDDWLELPIDYRKTLNVALGGLDVYPG